MDRMDNEEMDDENLVNEANAEDEEDKQNWNSFWKITTLNYCKNK